MKFAITPFTAQSITEFSQNGADIFIVGTDLLSNRLVHAFSNEEIKEISALVHKLNKELYVSLNIIVHHNDLHAVEEFLLFIKDCYVDGIIFADISVYQIAKRLEMEHLLIYNPETLNTNYYDTIFWHKKGIKGLTISKEITLEDISEISKISPIEISIVGHGHLNMFHSRRPLIENFLKYNENEYKKYIENRSLKLVEEIRDEAYPIFQDSHGTHIFRDKALESYQEIIELSNTIDVFIIDGIFKDNNYLMETLQNYHSILSKQDKDTARNISKHVESDHDSGFLYKKTVYDK